MTGSELEGRQDVPDPVDLDRSTRSRPRWWLTALLGLLVVLATVLFVRMLVVVNEDGSIPDEPTPLAYGATIASESAKDAGLVAATEATEKVLSYAATTIDDDIAAAQELLDAGMREEYTSAMEAIREQTVRNKAQVQAVVVAASIISADEDDAQALLFVNQTTTGRHLDEPRADLNRVVVTLRRDAGEWTVTDLDAL